MGVADSAAIMRRHDILLIEKKDVLKVFIIGLAMINNYFNCTPQNKADTKSACKLVICNIFGKMADFLLSMGILSTGGG